MKSPLGSIAIAAMLALVAFGAAAFLPRSVDPGDAPVAANDRAPRKLYWFIPDGMRAEPELFDVFRWAREGKLPNIRSMMERGTWGYSRPTFPSHTPTNFATLFTGCYPEVHGVNDGPMHTEGSPLDRVSIGGFSSLAKRVAPIWTTLERASERRVALLSVPGSTPPELERGITVRGRWGGWGADFHAVVFQDAGDLSMRREQGRSARLFFAGPALTQYPERQAPSGWPERLAGSVDDVEAFEVAMSAWGATVFALVHRSGSPRAAAGFDAIAFAIDKAAPLVTLRAGELSDWLPITLCFTVRGADSTRDVPTSFRIKVIKLADDGFFRVRLFYDNVNRFVTDPESIAAELVDGVGPMVDFVDNFPPQLVYFPEDKDAFLEEAGASLDWHRRAAGFLIDRHRPDVFISDIYTPNQMLTSRWWMGHIDPSSARYADVTATEREKLWSEVEWLYRKLDDIVGELLARADDDTIVVLSSDHGAVPLDRSVRLNNLFAREGLLRFQIDPETGEPRIDWEKTSAIYLKMQSVYIDPDGLAGPWKRASGPRYEALRERVRKLLVDAADADGTRPVVRIATWEEAEREFRLLPERVGDLVIANRPGYGWSEEMTADRTVFTTPLESGYKQAILPEDARGMWTPFAIVGPGVEPGRFLGDTPIEHVDQYATILDLLGVPLGEVAQGRPLFRDASESSAPASPRTAIAD